MLSVIDKSPYYGAQTVSIESSPVHMIENLEDYFRQTAEAYIAAAEDLCKTREVGPQRIVKAGHPVEAIIKAAGSSKVDLIVMGPHGKSALGAAILGSVTIGVIHRETKFLSWS